MLKLKDKNSKLMSFHVNDEKLLEKYKSIWTKIENLKDIELNALLVYDDGYKNTKRRRYGNKVYPNFGGLNVLEDDTECEFFTVISIDSLLVYENKYHLQLYFDNCAYKIINNKWQIILMEIFFKIKYYKCYITIELI